MTRRDKRSILVGAIIMVVIVAIAVALPVIIRARYSPPMSGCIHNLQQIEAAKDQWARNHTKTTNDTPSWNDLRPYLIRGTGDELPSCPVRGEYILGRVGEAPRCSTGGVAHSLNSH